MGIINGTEEACWHKRASCRLLSWQEGRFDSQKKTGKVTHVVFIITVQ